MLELHSLAVRYVACACAQLWCVARLSPLPLPHVPLNEAAHLAVTLHPEVTRTYITCANCVIHYHACSAAAHRFPRTMSSASSSGGAPSGGGAGSGAGAGSGGDGGAGGNRVKTRGGANRPSKRLRAEWWFSAHPEQQPPKAKPKIIPAKVVPKLLPPPVPASSSTAPPTLASSPSSSTAPTTLASATSSTTAVAGKPEPEPLGGKPEAKLLAGTLEPAPPAGTAKPATPLGEPAVLQPAAPAGKPALDLAAPAGKPAVPELASQLPLKPKQLHPKPLGMPASSSASGSSSSSSAPATLGKPVIPKGSVGKVVLPKKMPISKARAALCVGWNALSAHLW